MRIRKKILLSLVAIAAITSAIIISTRNNTTEIYEEKDRDRPDLAAEQEFEMTKDPALGYPPVERKIAAFKEAKKLLARKNAKAIDNVSWDERGPNNVGGRTRALIFDPNDPSGKKVFAGTVAGGLWYNDDITDGDSEWQNINDFMANLSISTLAYDPNNTQVFYAGTGLGFTGRLRGSGIWKSEDGGTTWNQLASTDNSDFRYTQKIVITSTSKVIAATLEGLMISDDGGDTWTTAISEDMTDIDLSSDVTNGEIIYASNYSGDIYKSTDDGDTWDDISPNDGGDRVELAAAPSNPLTVYAVAADGRDVEWFKKSTDAGENWTDITIPNYRSQNCQVSGSDFTRGQAFFDLILAVYPNDENSLIVGGIDLHRSTNGGTNWSMISYWTGGCDAYVHADQHAIVFKEGSDSEAIFGNDGGVYYSSNLDQSDPSFLEAINGYNTALFYAVASANEFMSNTYLAGTQDNGTQMFLNPGINSTIEVTGGDGAFCFIDQDDPNLMISSYVYNSYYLSTNGGGNFIQFVSNQNAGNFINQADYDDDANILYATGNDNEIIVYSDIETGSPTTTSQSVSIGNEQSSHIRVSPFTNNRILVGTEGGGVFVIDNANDTPLVTNIDNNQLPGGTVSCIEIGESDDHLLVTYSNYGVTSVWETQDGGTNWQNKEGNLPDMPVRWALYNPNDRSEVLLATEVGIWSTDDITDTDPEWDPSNEGLANVRCDMLQYRESDELVVVATFGRGLFTSDVFIENALASFDPSRKVAYIGKEIQFENTSVGPVTSSLWSFGDGVSSSSTDATHTYQSPGQYTVELVVNEGAQSASDRQTIYVLPNRDGDYQLSNGGDFEDFEDFFAENISGTAFEIGSSSISGKSGTTSGSNAWVTGLEETDYQNNSEALLYTPNFDLSQAGTYELSFQTKYSFEDDWEGFIVEYSTDGGDNWDKLNPNIESDWYNITTENNSVFGSSVPIFGGNTGDAFVKKVVDISSLSGSGRVAFRFRFMTDTNTRDIGMAIDDFIISGPATAAVPDFTANPQTLETCQSTEVTFFDNSTGNISSYSWDFGSGAEPATATGRGPHTVTYNSSGSATVSLTVVGSVNGSIAETKSDYLTISTNPISEKTINFSSSVCYGASTSITVVNAESDFSYQLYDNATNSPLTSATEGTNSDLDFEVESLTENKEYYVLASDLNSSCTKILDTKPLISITPPSYTDFNLTSNEICSGETLIATIDDSQESVNYYFIDAVTEEVLSDLFEGDGGELTIASDILTSNAKVNIRASSGTCDLDLSDETLIITVLPAPDASITAEGNTLVASSGGTSYQWYLDGELIEGEESVVITAIAAGEYTVEVTSNGCSSISDPFTPVVLAVEELIEKGELSFHPNPTNDVVNINQKGLFNHLKVYSPEGRVIKDRSIKNNEVISLRSYNAGVYIFELTGPEERTVFRINKTK